MEVIKSYVKSYKEYSKNEVFKRNNKHFLVEMINEKTQSLDMNSASVATVRESIILILKDNNIIQIVEGLSNNTIKVLAKKAYEEVKGVNFNVNKNDILDAHEVLSFNKFIKCILKYILIEVKNVRITSLFEVAVAKQRREEEAKAKEEKKFAKLKK